MALGDQKNNGRRLSLAAGRDGGNGLRNRDSISRWFRELEYYGFIVENRRGLPRGRRQGQGSAMALDRSRSARRTQWRYLELADEGLPEMGRHDCLRMNAERSNERGKENRNPGLRNEARVARNEARPGPRKRGHFTQQLARESEAISDEPTVARNARPYLG